MKKSVRFMAAAVLVFALTAAQLPRTAVTAAGKEAAVIEELGMFQPGGKLTMNVGDMINLRFGLRESGMDYFLTDKMGWASSDGQILSVELFKNGQNSIARTKALAVGTADIICTGENGTSAKMTVTVQDTSPRLTIKARGTSVRYASKWRTLVGIDGSYERVAKKKILNRINEIRREACKKKYPVPGNPNKKLSADDYVPIKWSSDLEWIAQIRAAEATVRQEHDRPNGRECFSVTHNGVMASAENLAWNYDGLMKGIEQWYEEKNDWVKQNQGSVTGHYESMIDPANVYVGIAGFAPTSGGWRGIAGEFVTEAHVIDSIYKDVRETVYRDNYIDRDEKYYDNSSYNDGLDNDELFMQIPLLADNPDGLDSLEDLERLYGFQSLEEYAKLADAGKLKLKLPEKQSDLKGRVIQMVEVISTRVGKPKIDAPKSIKKGKKKQLFVTREAYDVPSVVLDARWSSSNPSVLSIKKDGTITAKKAGKATVTAKFRTYTLKATIRVTK